mmetsp:Transcript_68633/g.210407  ORF Transcript_68633/g.210407 Transcript_68633/m.210407 type:complete len:361 (+) Transcript_68633:948-2030(+)
MPVFRQQLARLEDARHRRGGQRRRPDQHMGAGQVIQEHRVLCAPRQAADSDVANAASPVERLEESHVPHVVLQSLSENVRRIQSLATPLYKAAEIEIAEKIQVMTRGPIIILGPKLLQLVVGAHTQHPANDGARGRARKDPGQKPIEVQGFDDSEMVHPELRAPGQEQRAPAEAVFRLGEKAQLVFQWNRIRSVVGIACQLTLPVLEGDPSHSFTDDVDIFFDALLRASISDLEQLRVAYAEMLSEKLLTQEEQAPLDVSLLHQLLVHLRPGLQLLSVDDVRIIVLLPSVEAQGCVDLRADLAERRVILALLPPPPQVIDHSRLVEKAAHDSLRHCRNALAAVPQDSAQRNQHGQCRALP